MNGSSRFAGDVFPELARLQQHLDEIFQAGTGSSIRGLARGAFPAVNVGTSPETIEVLAFAPGVDPKGLQITIDKGLLVIAGERTPDRRQAQRRRNGLCAGALSRRLPARRQPARRRRPGRVEARFRDGVLHMTVNKRESSKPRQIAVN